jgi:hypothetical protein
MTDLQISVRIAAPGIFDASQLDGNPHKQTIFYLTTMQPAHQVRSKMRRRINKGSSRFTEDWYRYNDENTSVPIAAMCLLAVRPWHLFYYY